MREWGHNSNAKVEAVIGVGKVIWQIVTGELGFAAIAKMAWQAIIAMLPPVLIRILIEKLVAIIVPAAGALMAIVEALQAAWGTISSIITALERFIAFLKAVKGGGAGPQFAAALASAAIVVLDFVANFLIAKLGSGLKKLAGKLGGIAKRLMRKKKSAGGRSSRKSRRRRDRAGPGRRRQRGAPKPRRGRSKTKRPPARERAGKPRKRSEADRRERQRREKLKRLNRAKAELPPKINALLSRGVKGVVLKGRLLMWRLQYRLTALSISGSGDSARIIARVNPSDEVGRFVGMNRDELLAYVRTLAKELLTRPDVQAQAEAMAATQGTRVTSSGATIQTVVVPEGTSIPARFAAGQRLPELGKGQHREITYAGTDTSIRQVQSPFREGREHQLIKEAAENGLTAKRYVQYSQRHGRRWPRIGTGAHDVSTDRESASRFQPLSNRSASDSHVLAGNPAQSCSPDPSTDVHRSAREGQEPRRHLRNRSEARWNVPPERPRRSGSRE